jgi:hypothetical protein
MPMPTSNFLKGTGVFKGGYLQDPGVVGMTTGDTSSGIPTTYTQGGTTIPLVGPSTVDTRIANPFGTSRPDLSTLIAGDYETQNAETQMASRMAALKSSFTDNVRKSLVDLGLGDTAKLGKFGSYIDQATIQNAIANKYSANAQIQTSQDKANAQMQAALAARGALSSGQFSKSAGDIAGDAEKSRYDALQQFLSSGEQGLTDIGTQESALAGAVAQARANAAQRASQYDLGWLNYQAGADQAPPTDNTGAPLAPQTPAPPKITPKAPAKPAVVKSYNPAAYVPGYASPALAKAIQAKGKKK